MTCRLALMSSLSTAALAAGPQVVSGPGADADCLKPWSSDTKYLKWPKKDGPYRIALVNGFIGNTWRIQMIKTAKAYAEKSDVKSQLKEFKVSRPAKISPRKSPLPITSSIPVMTR